MTTQIKPGSTVKLSTGSYNGFIINEEVTGTVMTIEDKEILIRLNPAFITVSISYIDIDGVLCAGCDNPIDMCICDELEHYEEQPGGVELANAMP